MAWNRAEGEEETLAQPKLFPTFCAMLSTDMSLGQYPESSRGMEPAIQSSSDKAVGRGMGQVQTPGSRLSFWRTPWRNSEDEEDCNRSQDGQDPQLMFFPVKAFLLRKKTGTPNHR